MAFGLPSGELRCVPLFPALSVILSPSCMHRLMWIAGIFAAFASIIYPAISSLVSKSTDAEQQGVVLGILTGMRGLCNGLGPAIFGLLFWLSNVNLSEEPDLTPATATVATVVDNVSRVSISMEAIVHVSP